MVDARRAYGRWLGRRLLWLVPSFLLSCAVCLDLLSDPDLPEWIRLPSLALAVGVATVFLALAAQTLLVLRERALGRTRRAQLLRKELGPYPGIGLASLVLLLVLLAVPSLFPGPAPLPVPPQHRRTVVERAAERPVEPARPAVPAAEAAAPEAPAPRPAEPAAIPSPLPEVVRAPEFQLPREDLKAQARPPVQDDGADGRDRFGFKHRPGADEDLFRDVPGVRSPYRRAGLPSGSDPDSWVPPELHLDVTIVTRSGPWRGMALETEFEMPFGREESVQLTYGFVMLADQEKLDDVELNFGWHRGTLEYVRRLAGYTRESTLDLAIRIGMSVDHLRIHEGDERYDISHRYSPWVGLESSIWQDETVGLLLQAGHSFATRLGGSSSRVTDLRVVVRIDLGERSSLEVGYRLLSVRFRDQLHEDTDRTVERMNRTFMGPIAGLVVRF
jgi:hypothetical protein